ncbi:MAG: hypothetical protein IID45_00445 [Planctomycetes bacterium]|nr:hypothetical protein [Planctomycetota bacterium]
MKCLTKPFLPGGIFTVVAVVCLAASSADAQTKLAWKFKAGEKLNYSMVQKMNTATTVQGRNIEMKMNQTMDMVWKISKVETNGTASIAQTITRIRFVRQAGPLNKMEYDSDKLQAGGNPALQPMTKIFDALVGQEFTLKMSPLGKITDIKMPKKFLNAIQGAGAGGIPGMMNKDTFKEMIGKASIIFPASGVTRGKTWNQTFEMKAPFGNIKVATAYKYLGTTRKGGATLARISVVPKITFTPKLGALIKVDLLKQEGSGTILFDINSGRLVGSSLKQKMVMKLQIGGQSFEQTIDQTVEMKLGSRSR